MFDTSPSSVEFSGNGADFASSWTDDGFDDLVYLITVDELSAGWVDGDRDVLPDIEAVPPGPFLAVVL